MIIFYLSYYKLLYANDFAFGPSQKIKCHFNVSLCLCLSNPGRLKCAKNSKIRYSGQMALSPSNILNLVLKKKVTLKVLDGIYFIF